MLDLLLDPNRGLRFLSGRLATVEKSINEVEVLWGLKVYEVEQMKEYVN